MKMILMFAMFAALAACGQQETVQTAQSPAAQGALAPAGDRIQLPGGGWFTWGFAEKPKLGTAIMKVQVYDKAGTRATPYEVIGEYGMPSMRYHDSGPVKFQLNRKGDYLLPVNIVMAGEWEVLIRLIEGKEKIYEGKVLFTI